MDIASNLAYLVHNDTGHGGYYNDLDMLQVGQGDFDVRTGGAAALARVRSHYTQHVMLRSTLLLSTVLSELPAHVIDLFKNTEVIAIHQDPWSMAARRVASSRPAVTELRPPFNAWMVVRKCEKGNPRQIWHYESAPPGIKPSAPARLWTTDEQGRRWCAGEGSWARAAEVMPCDDPSYLPDADESDRFGCNLTSPCGHKTQNFTAQLGPVCEAGVTEPRYCPSPHLGGMVGEGVGCDITLSCERGQIIKDVTFADWGLPFAEGGADPLTPGADCRFASNHTADSRGQVCTAAAAAVAGVRRLCMGRSKCTITHAFIKSFGDPCGGVNKRFAVSTSGCVPAAGPPPPFVRDRFELGIYWDGGGNGAVPAAAAGSGPLPHSRYIGASPMAIDIGTFDVWYHLPLIWVCLHCGHQTRTPLT
jgi:hypothetical protein